jgi:hypothetical protein
VLANATPTVSTLITARNGRIVRWDDPAARLLHLAEGGGLPPGSLARFFASGRARVLVAQRAAGRENGAWVQATLRARQPEDRSPRPVSVSVRLLVDGHLEWVILGG